MNFQWNLFEFTAADCQLLGKALQATPTLKVFRLRESKVSTERGRVLVAHLLDHPSLQTLGKFFPQTCRTVDCCVSDLSHNCLSDGGGRALGKLLNDHSPQLTRLDVSNNQLEEAAGMSIGHALQRNTALQELNLSMNRLGDQGSQYILKALFKNKTLTVLNLSSNDMGEPSAPTLADVCIFTV